ncbi:MAG: IscS subfamily cysteine desulfurase [Patescibacteria group bacterium]
MKRIYLDHAATTPVDPAVFRAMKPFFCERFANPSSFHTAGLEVQREVIAARKNIASMINAHEDEIIFCSGGTESDNLAIQGIVRAHADHGNHVITSSIEHPAVLETLQRLHKRGEIELTILDVDEFGLIDVKNVVKALTKKTILVSVMTANNEIGTIEPIADIGRAILQYRKEHETAYPLFHTDACQAAGAMDLDVTKSHVDLLTINGGKIYGPKGIGLLYVKRGIKITPMIIGGGQEKGLRSGTENVPGIIGFAKALELVSKRMEKENARLSALRDHLIAGLLKIPKTRLNGHATKRLPNNVNISFMDIEGEAAVLYLDAKGICTSTGSACASTTLDPSHVILALGVSYEAAHGSLRFSLGKDTTKEDIEYVIRIMPDIVKKLRHMSPVNLDMRYFESATKK